MKRLWIKLIASLPLSDTTVIIANGEIVTLRGRVRSKLVSELGELAKTNGITDACIHASTADSAEYQLSLFGIPENLHQRFRNVWGINRA